MSKNLSKNLSKKSVKKSSKKPVWKLSKIWLKNSSKNLTVKYEKKKLSKFMNIEFAKNFLRLPFSISQITPKGQFTPG